MSLVAARPQVAAAPSRQWGLREESRRAAAARCSAAAAKGQAPGPLSASQASSPMQGSGGHHTPAPCTASLAPRAAPRPQARQLCKAAAARARTSSSDNGQPSRAGAGSPAPSRPSVFAAAVLADASMLGSDKGSLMRFPGMAKADGQAAGASSTSRSNAAAPLPTAAVQAAVGVASSVYNYFALWGQADRIKWEREAPIKAAQQAAAAEQFAAVALPTSELPRTRTPSPSRRSSLASGRTLRAGAAAGAAAIATSAALREKVAAALAGENFWLPSPGPLAAPASFLPSPAPVEAAQSEAQPVGEAPAAQSTEEAIQQNPSAGAATAKVQAADPTVFEPLVFTYNSAGRQAFVEGVVAFQLLSQPASAQLREAHASVFHLLTVACNLSRRSEEPAWRTMHLPCNSGLLQAARRRVPSLLAAFEDSEELMPLYKMLAGHDVNQVLGTLVALSELAFAKAEEPSSSS